MVSSKEGKHQKMVIVIRYILAITIISLMGAASMTLRDKAVIYPPAAAMLLGLIIKERQPWHVSPWSIPVLLTLSAFVGTILEARLEAYPVTALSLGFLFTGALLLITEATLFPTLATCLLPIVLHTTSWMYSASVLMLSTLTILISTLITRGGWRQSAMPSFHTASRISIGKVRHWLLMWISMLPLLIAAQQLHKGALIAPPLIVVLVSLCQPDDRKHRHPRRVLATIFLSSCCGVFCRMVLLDGLSMPLFIVLPLAMVLSLIVMNHMRLIMPPIAALSLLPFALSGNVLLFPLLVSAGAAYMLLCTRTEVRKFIIHRMALVWQTEPWK